MPNRSTQRVSSMSAPSTCTAKGHTPATRVEDAKKRLIDLEKRLASQKLELETRIALAEKNIGKRYFTGRDMVGEIQRVSAEIKRAEGLLELDRQRYEVAKSARERLAVTAPFTGTVLQLPRLHNGHVKAGETIALFEKSGERGITAFLTQDEVLDVELGGFVDVFIPATGEIADAQIIDIDRTMGFFRQASKRSPVRLQWRESKERTARVTLAFVDTSVYASDRRYRAGLPVTVNFSRKSGGYVLAHAKRTVATIAPVTFLPTLHSRSQRGAFGRPIGRAAGASPIACANILRLRQIRLPLPRPLPRALEKLQKGSSWIPE